MKSKVSFCILAVVACFSANAQDVELDNALRETYMNCVGIDDALHDMKVKAGINTAVTGVGTGLGIGAVATGIAKAKTDSILQQKFAELKDLAYSAHGEYEEADKEKFKEYARQRLFSSKDGVNSISEAQDKEIKELDKKSKKLGNWRTGLLVGNTATNIAGAAISGTNKVNKTPKRTPKPTPNPQYYCPDGYSLHNTTCSLTVNATLVCPENTHEYGSGGVSGCINFSEGVQTETESCPSGYGLLKMTSIGSPDKYYCYPIHSKIYHCENGFTLSNGKCTRTINANKK